jgi:hypothetical protein
MDQKVRASLHVRSSGERCVLATTRGPSLPMGLASEGMQVETRVASPEPAMGVFTPAGACPGRLLSAAPLTPSASLRDRLRRPWTEPACRKVPQQSGSGERLGRTTAQPVPW